MNIGKVIGLSLLGLVVILALSWGFGWFDVFNTRTVGKAQMNAHRLNYEQSQSFVEGKKTQLIKLHHEWVKGDASDRVALEEEIRQSFSEFNEDLYLQDQPELYTFLHRIKMQ